MQIVVTQASNRLSPQSALERYYEFNNNSVANWSRTNEDYDALFSGSTRTRMAVQARIYRRDTSDEILFSRTANSMLDVQLPYNGANGQPATFGDPDSG